jgi:hypothetical protein
MKIINENENRLAEMTVAAHLLAMWLTYNGVMTVA